MTTFIGAGLSGAGTSDAGYGAIDAGAIPSPNMLVDPFAPLKLSSPRIDPVTRDYAVDAQGNPYGMTRAQQYVELVFITEIGTSCIPALGNRLKDITVISDSFVQDVQQTIRTALSEGTASGLITIRSIDVIRFGTTGAFIKTVWRDNATGREFEKVI